MSASSISRAANDPDLQKRVVALANKEVLYDDALAETWYGIQIRTGMANYQLLYWPIAVQTELEYETAINSGRGAPGYDQDIVPDAEITSAIVANWPPQPPSTMNPPTTPAAPVVEEVVA